MRTSRFPLHTLREAPSDAEIASHKLMFRAGLIRKLASGIYTWLPLGWRVLKKVEQIIREEMDRAGALELLMPALQPAELWHESGRWEKYGPELMRIKDRHERDFCLGPTHEEVITDLVRHEIKSYKQLPLNYYQIQTKFRDEIRPRFGVMRAREFLMKDAYSFHRDEASLQETYELMKETYSRIFSRMGLDFRVVLAPTGAIGGHLSHEFHVLAETGEARIALSTEGDYAANLELAEAAPPRGPRPEPKEPLRKVATPGKKTIEAVARFLKVPLERCLKTVVVRGREGGVVALFLRGDHELNPLKAERLEEVAVPLQFASEEEIEEAFGCPPGYLGPIGLEGVPMVVDRDAAFLSDFVCGANEEGYHYVGANWERDLPLPKVADLRFVKEGDPSPDGRGRLVIKRGIEVGHIFQLGTRYSEALNATALDEEGREFYLVMGCYGIGVSRVVAAAIEQNHDEKGIIWPGPIAPFGVAIVPIGYHRSQKVREAAEALYRRLLEEGLEPLLDDREVSPGVMFNDIDLIGIPHRVVVGERLLAEGLYEYRHRRSGATFKFPLERLLEELRERRASR